MRFTGSAPQVVFLSTFTEAQIDKVKLLNVFYPLVGVVNGITSKLPGVFLKVGTTCTIMTSLA